MHQSKEGIISKNYKPTIEEMMLLLHQSEGKDRLIVVGCGFMGMREGELIHMRPSWLHIGDRTAITMGSDHVKVPSGQQDCDCMDCQFRAYVRYKTKIDKKKGKEYYKQVHTTEWHSKVSEEFYKLPIDKNGSRIAKLGLKPYWKPKSINSSRMIPISLPIVRDVLVNYYVKGKHEAIGMDRWTVWRRINHLGTSILGRKLFPHALRSGYASILASDKGITSGNLKKLLGWSNLTTADSYIEGDAIVAMKAANKVSNELFARVK